MYSLCVRYLYLRVCWFGRHSTMSPVENNSELSQNAATNEKSAGEWNCIAYRIACETNQKYWSRRRVIIMAFQLPRVGNYRVNNWIYDLYAASVHLTSLLFSGRIITKNEWLHIPLFNCEVPPLQLLAYTTGTDKDLERFWPADDVTEQALSYQLLIDRR